ncbi:MAG TPA: pilin [Patescibacteria group bacterium]|nr:pilin [Patescibacteria group bacterium]
MSKTIIKTTLGIVAGMFAISTFLSVAAVPAQAQTLDADDLGTNYAEQTGLSNQDPRTTVANIINVVLGFLGILAVVIILVGGFKWMTAAGNEDKVAEAKKIIVAGIIGLVIILAAWGIASFVLNALVNNV